MNWESLALARQVQLPGAARGSSPGETTFSAASLECLYSSCVQSNALTSVGALKVIHVAAGACKAIF